MSLLLLFAGAGVVAESDPVLASARRTWAADTRATTWSATPRTARQADTRDVWQAAPRRTTWTAEER